LSTKLQSIITYETVVIIHNDFHHLSSSTIIIIIIIRKSGTIRLNENVKGVMEIKCY